MSELLHQGRGELVEGVGEDDHLVLAAQPGEKLARALERAHAADHGLDVAQTQAVLVEDRDAVAHQLVVVRLVARGDAQRLDAGGLGDVDPDLGDEHAFQIEADDHGRLASGSAEATQASVRDPHGASPAAAAVQNVARPKPRDTAAARGDRHR